MRRLEHAAALNRTVAGGESFLVDAEKRSLAHALPQCRTVRTESLDLVHSTARTPAEGGSQPMCERAGNVTCERQHALPPEYAIGFLIIRIYAVTWICQQHRRHPESQKSVEWIAFVPRPPEAAPVVVQESMCVRPYAASKFAVGPGIFESRHLNFEK